MANPRHSNSAQLRNDIDQGRTGDKVRGFDPAAAPLGTDDEAGGAPPSAAAIAQARVAERRKPRGHNPNAANPRQTPDGHAEQKRKRAPFVAALLVVLVLLAIYALFLLS